MPTPTTVIPGQAQRWNNKEGKACKLHGHFAIVFLGGSYIMENMLERQHLLAKLLSFAKFEYQHRYAKRHQFDWRQQARPEQLPPQGDWRVWLILAGRGFGKTRTGSETIRRWVTEEGVRRIALVGQTEAEVRDVMIEGQSGLLSVHPDEERPIFEPSKRRLTWPNGSTATVFSAENPEQLRGPQFEACWIDEFAKFRNPQEVWDQLNFCLRLGPHPRTLITTTPKNTKMLKYLLSGEGTWVTVTRGQTFDNAANLSPAFIEEMKRRYGATRLGQQELYGLLLEDIDGALWRSELIEPYRVKPDQIPTLSRVVVAVDPAITAETQSDETGIIVAGIDSQEKVYVLKDLSGRYTPLQWGHRAVEAYHSYQADRVVFETNQGGDMVQTIIHQIDATISFKGVHATRGKAIRAEPVVALYEQGHVHHASVGLEKLEQQLLEYVPGESKKSPDRLDALVWAITELRLQPRIIEPSVWGF